jgi:D-tyrosyl-tRNA(Tyr) deacylase
VSVGGEVVGEIGRGVVVLVGVTHGDVAAQAEWLARKIAGLRIFEDDEGKINAGLLDVGGAALVISQFTLYADARKGRRPSFTAAAPPEVAEPLVERFVQVLQDHGVPVETGVFGAHMLVEIHNDGPVTILLER